MTSTAREQRTKARKKYAKHPLEELWEADLYDSFYKIFTRETKKGIIKYLSHSKAQLREFSCM